MNKPHEHAELIKKWADGAEIEFFDGCHWVIKTGPCWHENQEYRLKRPAWQQKLIDAAKAGKEVQIFLGEYWIRSFLNDELDNYNFQNYSPVFFRIKNKLTDEQRAFSEAAGHIGIGDRVEEYFELDLGFWDSRPDEDLIRIHDTYLVWRDAIAYAKQLKDKP